MSESSSCKLMLALAICFGVVIFFLIKCVVVLLCLKLLNQPKGQGEEEVNPFSSLNLEVELKPSLFQHC